MQNVESVSALRVTFMVERKTMRPVTLKRIVEICSLASQNDRLNVEIVSRKLGVSHSRAKEILLEVEKMGLLSKIEDFWLMNDKTSEFLEYFEKEEWSKMHQHFLNNYLFYREFIRILEYHISDEEGLSVDEVYKESLKYGFHLNRTAIEVLADWCERLGVIQRNLYTGKLYLIKQEVENLNDFYRVLIKSYRKLSVSRWRREVFVEIPIIREQVCERLKISRKIFDQTLKTIYLKNVGKIEFSGAPIVTHAKRSPLSEKMMTPDAKKAILSPRFKLKREREGLLIGRKSYYYIAIHLQNLQ